MPSLATIVDALSGVIAVRGPIDRTIGAIRYDSRQVGETDLFVAINGPDDRALGFVDAAVRQGARAVILDDPDRMDEVGDAAASTTWILVADARIAMAEAARRCEEMEQQGIRIFGVTGTNGKTTVAHVLRSIFAASGRATGMIGTLGAVTSPDGEITATGYTTPESPELYRLLATMKKEGITDVAMEVSSHALVLHRVAGLRFDGAIYTNISQEHLDFHNSFEDYLDAKKRLFDELDAAAHAVVNIDDLQGRAVVRDTDADVAGYGHAAGADFRVDRQECRADGSTWVIEFSERFGGGSRQFACDLVGSFNVMNVTAACAMAAAVGVDPDLLVEAVADLEPVPGRMQSVSLRSGARAIVDYAHTPDALANLLESVRGFLPESGRLHLLFGCGGDRDRTKRPEMGRIASEMADRIWVTSDNPRTESPEAIIEEIVGGIARPPDAYATIPDRRAAIAAALAELGERDLLVVAGKGHEKVQIVGTERLEFDDVAVVQQEDETGSGTR